MNEPCVLYISRDWHQVHSSENAVDVGDDADDGVGNVLNMKAIDSEQRESRKPMKSENHI